MLLFATQSLDILFTLFVMLAAAKVLAEIFERLRQPAIVGEILAGVLIGPSVLRWVAPSEITNTLAEVGVIFLLFSVGLATKPVAIFRVGRAALLVAVLGVAAPFVAGVGWHCRSITLPRYGDGCNLRRYHRPCVSGNGPA